MQVYAEFIVTMQQAWHPSVTCTLQENSLEEPPDQKMANLEISESALLLDINGSCILCSSMSKFTYSDCERVYSSSRPSKGNKARQLCIVQIALKVMKKGGVPLAFIPSYKDYNPIYPSNASISIIVQDFLAGWFQFFFTFFKKIN